MPCDFIKQLSVLRKLSAESIENTNTFDSFKDYLHVKRQVEVELRAILRRINNEQNKSLVLLCGSAGDGKSHLISYLKNSDPEGLLDSFEPYNDATESSAPQLTAIETLAEKLKAFNDENYLVDDGIKIIVAINLGMLNNFIESEHGKNFTELKKYVAANEIFSGYAYQTNYHPGSVFQHVSFSDYQVFALSENGIKTDYLERLIGRIFCKSDKNPFYTAFVKNETCSMCQRCPVRHNFSFMSEHNHQKAVIRRIVEIAIKDKAIISTREVLNLIYDILVHPDFSYEKLCACSTSDIKYLSSYIAWTTPMLLNEYDDISFVLNEIKKHDLLKTRKVDIDEDATRFHSMENIEDVFSIATAETPYIVLKNLAHVSVLGGIKADLKKIVYKFITRLKEMSNEFEEQEHLKEYMQYIFYQNSGNEKKLAKLYDATKRAIHNFDGQFDEDYICIDDTNDRFWVLEQLQLKSAIYKSHPESYDSIQRFSPTIKLRFKKENGNELDTAEISIDFALFELISDMKEGYLPTVQDKNRHADFVSFVQRLVEFGNKSSRITLVPKDNGQQYKVVFEETEFGFQFKVV